ncbi:MAG: sensor histidine kinase, partial [Firmicutes bacterium]|nr:sensor histidine kinase [Bacillota bacterium]
GPGIPEDQLPHIWDRYYKYSRTGTRAASGSSGLGLAIVKEILLAHKARFGVRSTLGKGSTFWFTLPLEQDQRPTEPPAAE